MAIMAARQVSSSPHPGSDTSRPKTSSSIQGNSMVVTLFLLPQVDAHGNCLKVSTPPPSCDQTQRWLQTDGLFDGKVPRALVQSGSSGSREVAFRPNPPQKRGKCRCIASEQQNKSTIVLTQCLMSGQTRTMQAWLDVRWQSAATKNWELYWEGIKTP
jgi:hypothetical protein